MPRKKTADTPPRAAKPPEADKREPASAASADAMLLTLTVAALTPVIDVMMALSAADRLRIQEAVLNQARRDTAALASLTASVNAMLG